MYRKVLVTGAGSGLGLELINTLKKNNIDCISHTHSGTEYLTGDICDVSTRKKIIETFISENCNVLINNVGIYRYKSLLDYTEEEIFKIINTNLVSTILLTKGILDFLSKKGSGSIYNINSVAGVNGSKYESIYCASKFGLKGFTDSIIQEFRDQKKIKIINVTLGAFKSKITSSRPNYDDLSDPKEIAEKIFSDIMENYTTIKNDLHIYRN